MIYDCQSCGACCENPHVTLWVRGDDGAYLEQGAGGRCVHLDGVIGQACRCAIYEHRPQVCRAFQPGSYDCLDLRALHHL